MEVVSDFTENIQKLSPELREIIYKNYVSIKLRERAVLGWGLVHKQISTTKYSFHVRALCSREQRYTLNMSLTTYFVNSKRVVLKTKCGNCGKMKSVFVNRKKSKKCNHINQSNIEKKILLLKYKNGILLER